MDTVLFTFNGETDGRSWTAEYYSGASASSLGGILTITSSLVLSSSSSASSGTSTSPGSTTEPAKSTNVGPIVGGVVGGLAVIGATACGVIFLLLRRRKRKNDLAAAASGTPGEAGPPTVYPQYNPNTGAAGGVDAGGAAGYYNHDNKAQMAQMPPYPQTPGNQYPGGGQQQKYEPSSPYQDNNRVSTFSEAPHSYVLPYQPSMHQVPMELDASSSVPHHGQGQPIYEAPTSNN
jgi:hypothetical protein